MRLSAPLLLLSAVSALACGHDAEAPEVIDCNESPGKQFQTRIEPLLTTDRANSCAECHAGGVTLTDFVRSEPCEAMACLKEQGLVDLKHPTSSVLLSWISRGESQSSLIDQEVIDQEAQAFLEWIEHEAACGLCAEVDCPDYEPSECESLRGDEDRYREDSDPGDCGQETLERLFRGTVYTNRGRCSPCHFESNTTAAASAPRFIVETGTCQVASLSTMLRITGSGYVNQNEPSESLLLTKPLPESRGGVAHGGHDKFSGPGDSGYESFLYFLERYSACQN